ncbi:MAG: hypothetical protein COT81_03740 [Candidatus Buchananbacteria bacterium CG10_big_fil_rev_8_21_14_0_10_42_9]|uniref:PilN domain-containing protein n=1 Tax=Candidatus Buchananbacteria bacterium CG10_big_fil_rev_8_21_14_0_10_42_9 TaxID=1974526 RepID=A0A2H0W0T9_9BACT|nr:MAG: hypothetical protein COT81_03740 [Candidatus Buchananbacteria bacterium CG10_big_fil_rev_8_21_14_0_10_42_9]
MADNINLLPDDLRGQEDKFKGKVKDQIGPLNLTDPKKEGSDKKIKPKGKPNSQAKAPVDILSAVEDVPYDFEGLAKGNGNKKNGPPAPASTGDIKIPPPPRPPKKLKPSKPKKPKKNKSQGRINLIPKGLIDSSDIKWKDKFSLLALVVILSLITVGVAYSLIIWYQIQVASDLQAVEKEIVSMNELIDKEQVGLSQAQALQNRLYVFDDRFRQHIYWSPFFELLENSISHDVFYTNMSANAQGNVTIEAIGRGFKAAAEQLVAFQRQPDMFSNVTVNQVKRSQGEIFLGDAEITESVVEAEELVNFVINLKVNPSIFKPSQ